MKFKRVVALFLVVVFLLLLNEIGCIANYNNHEENLIKDEDRRGADSYHLTDHAKPGGYKRGLYEASGTYNRQKTYTAEADADYGEAATFTSPGYSHGPQTHSVAQYYPTYSTDHGSYGSFGQTGSYGSLGQTGHGVSYAYGHTAPSYGHGYTAPSQGHGHGGHHPLALKGLLIPLAGIALLGAAAALSANPVLLQLGVVNGRRRRRRSFGSSTYHRLQ